MRDGRNGTTADRGSGRYVVGIGCSHRSVPAKEVGKDTSPRRWWERMGPREGGEKALTDDDLGPRERKSDYEFTTDGRGEER